MLILSRYHIFVIWALQPCILTRIIEQEVTSIKVGVGSRSRGPSRWFSGQQGIKTILGSCPVCYLVWFEATEVSGECPVKGVDPGINSTLWPNWLALALTGTIRYGCWWCSGACCGQLVSSSNGPDQFWSTPTPTNTHINYSHLAWLLIPGSTAEVR